MKNLNLLLITYLLFSCSLDKGKDKSPLNFNIKDSETAQTNVDSGNNDAEDIEELTPKEQLQKIEDDKKLEWERIIVEAKLSFEPIRELTSKKCFDCHNSNRDLPFYGRILPRYNPVTKHQVDGLKALDMAEIFPLKAQGEPTQLSLLNALKSSVLDRTMPLKSYKIFYPSRKIKDEDEQRFLDWVDPLIEKIENFEEKYNDLYAANDLKSRATKIVQAKCLRCHGNGVSKGGFGGMENFESLSDAETSLIYSVSESGEMPPDQRMRLTADELQLLKDYIASLK